MLVNSPNSISTVYSGCSLFKTGSYTAISIKENIKKGPRERKKEGRRD